MAVELYIGDTWQGDVEVLGDDDAPVNLTAATYEFEWRRPGSGVEILADATTVEAIDEEAGTLLWTVTDEDTAGVEPGPVRFGLRVTLADGTSWTVLDQIATITRGPVR